MWPEPITRSEWNQLRTKSVAFWQKWVANIDERGLLDVRERGTTTRGSEGA